MWFITLPMAFHWGLQLFAREQEIKILMAKMLKDLKAMEYKCNSTFALLLCNPLNDMLFKL